MCLFCESFEVPQMCFSYCIRQLFHHQEFKSKQDMAEKSAITGFLAFFCLLSSAFFIASIVVAVQDGDDSCQGHDKTMSLKTWLLVTGNLRFRCTDCINHGFVQQKRVRDRAKGGESGIKQKAGKGSQIVSGVLILSLTIQVLLDSASMW